MNLSAKGETMTKCFSAICCVLAFSVALLAFVLISHPAELDLKPGNTIGPQNWQRAQGMVGENFLNRIKQGHTIQIKAPKIYRPLKEYTEATEKNSGRVSLGPNGELLNYVSGQPFPKLDLGDAQIGQKLAWNFFWRWLGDDYKTGGAVQGGKDGRAGGAQ